MHARLTPIAGARAPIEFPAATAHVAVLPNGLTIIVQEDHGAPVASVQAWCATGSIHEGEKLGSGMSHMLEHMLFKGTDSRGPNEIAQQIQDTGGYINAYTSFDRTVYWIDTPSKGVPVALDILADAMLHSTLPPDEYVKEQEVIRREFAMGYDDPDRMSQIEFFATAFKEHPYRLPIIGHLDIYNQLTRDQVMGYYKARYVPNNLIFVVAGDVDTARVEEQLGRLFEKEARRSLPPLFIPQEPPQLGRRELHKEFATEVTRLDMGWHVPELTHPDLPALDLLAAILGDGRSSRLYREIRERAALAHTISAYCYSPGNSGLFGINANLDPDNRTAVETAVLDIVAELQRSGPGEAELAKAKKRTLSHQLQSLVSMRGKASDLGSNWLLTRNLNFSRDYLASIQNVTADDIQRVATAYLTERNLTVTSLNPPGSLTASAKAHTGPAAGEIQKFDLSNGMRLLVREDSRLPLVSAVAVFKAGVLAETPETSGATRLLARVILKGTTSRTADELAEEIEAVGGSVSADSGNNSFTVATRVMQPDLPLAIELLADVLVHPTFPEAAVEREKQFQIARIKEDEEELTSVARNIVREQLFGDHPYALRPRGTAESVPGLSRETIAALHRQYVVSRNCVLAVFGNVRAADVKALVEEAFAAMPEGDESPLENIPSSAPPAATVVKEELRDKTQAVLMIGYLGSDLYGEDQFALELIDEASSDLGSRFFIRIREQMGLAYFVGTSHLPGLTRGSFVFYLGTAPEKVEPVRRAFEEEIAALAAEGLSDLELARAKEKLIGQQEIRNQNNDTFAYTTALDELYGLGFDHYKHVTARVAAVTGEDVRRVANKYFLDQNHVIAIVRPPQPKESHA
jgi:zinc protease